MFHCQIKGEDGSWFQDFIVKVTHMPAHYSLPDELHSPQNERKVEDSLTYSFSQVTLRKGESNKHCAT